MKKKTRLLLVMTMLLIAAAACGPRVEPTPTIDPEEIMAQVAMTIEAEITANALLTPSATATLPPTATPPPLPTLPIPTLPPAPRTLPPGSADNATFVADITIPDGTTFLRNARFTKTWKIENTGTTRWDSSYDLIYIDGPIMSENLIIPITVVVDPGVQIEISVPMTAPDTLGTATSYWQMMNGIGQRFGDVLFVQIVVGTELTPTPDLG